MRPKLIITALLIMLLSKVIAQGQTQTLKQGDNKDSITSVYFTNNGKNILASSLYDKIVMWDIQTGTKIWQLSFEGRRDERDYFVTKIYQMVLSPDGNTIALVRDRFRVVNNTLKETEWQIVLVNLNNRQERQIIYRGEKPISSITFSPDNQLLAWSEYDRIHFWSVKAKTELPSFVSPRCPTSLAFSPNGKLLAAGLTWASSCKYDSGTEGLIIINVQNGERVNASFGSRTFNDVTFSPDSKFLVAVPMDSQSDILVWNVETWERVNVLKDAEVPVDRVAFSSDGDYLASRFGIINRGIVFVWKVRSDTKPQLHRFGEGVWSINFSPDGERLAVGTENGRIKLLRMRRV